MCFTINIHLTRKAIEDRFRVDTSALYDFSFNYFYRAFSNPNVPVIAMEDPGRVELMQWGLVPSWAGEREQAETIRKGTYNARAETLHEKPSFKQPLVSGRCLVIARGFFEWQLVNGVKIPWYISQANAKPFVFAGLYDSWMDADSGEVLRTFSIITTSANALMARIHNTKKRMPVILEPGSEFDWIEGEISLLKRNRLLLPIENKALIAHTVAPSIGSPTADPSSPSMIQVYDYPVSGTLF